MIRWVVLFVFSSVCIFCLTIYYRLGGFRPVKIREGKYHELILLYKEHKGAYDKIASVISEVEHYAHENEIPCPQAFGEYFDDPRVVEERQLTSIGGCLLKKPIKDSEYKIKVVPEKKYIIATFTGAPSISPLTVYPKVETFMEERNYKRAGSVIEVYTIQSNNNAATEYLFSVETFNP